MNQLPYGRFGLQRIVLGNLPLLGISYQNRQKDEENKRKFSNKGEIKKIIRVALGFGVRFLAASSGSFNEIAPLHLQAIKELEREDEAEIRLIPCLSVPIEFRGRKVNDYKRWKTHLSFETKGFGEEVKKRILEDPILNSRIGWKETLNSAKEYDKKQLERNLEVNWALWEQNVDFFSNYDVAWLEPGSETDFLAITRIDLLEELLDTIKDQGYRTLLGSHHLGVSAPIIHEKKVRKFDGYVSPVNKLGIMMFPTKIKVEESVRKTVEENRLIVGIKPFGGGRIRPEEALSYVYKELRVDSCMIGVGSVDEAKEDIRIAKGILADEKKSI